MKKSKKYKQNKNSSLENLVNHSQSDEQLKAQLEESQAVDKKVAQKRDGVMTKNNLF